MHKPAKFALVFTSLLPVLLGYGISHVIDPQKREWCAFGICFVLAAMVLGVAWFILSRAKKTLGRVPLKPDRMNSNDQQLLAFLLAYILPLTSGDSLTFKHPVAALYVLGLLVLCIYHSNAFHFNPILSLFFGYHFYEAETEGRKYTLITRRSHPNVPEDPLTVIELADHVYLEVDCPQQSEATHDTNHTVSRPPGRDD